MAIKGIIFDFDGLICDTESTELHAWKKLYADFDLPFPFEEYQKTIGAVHNDETPLRMLKDIGGKKVNLEDARNRLHYYHSELVEAEPLRPGVLAYLQDAKSLGLKIGLASSSPIAWVSHHLDRLRIMHYFECIKTLEDVNQTKPDPQLFIKTLKCLQLLENEAIALEDSINGVLASKKAGLITVAVPNKVTQQFNFDIADLVLTELTEMPLNDLIHYFNN